MKQTAVEWLQNEIPSIDWENSYWKSRFQQAKEMEKQQKGYSEEEVLEILYKHTEDLLAGKKVTLEEWFKQFKNR